MNKEHMQFPELSDNELEMTAGGARSIEDMTSEMERRNGISTMERAEMRKILNSIQREIVMYKEVYKDILENRTNGNGSDDPSGM